ncbi:MurT ligase domain-containing protein, partial [Candidatus Saccharibacteria bacterium]|nr:MurT ligase domain-containing protein [Candidatus Saccharibacteria bacterium]
SALPGLIIEKIDKNFLKDHLSGLKYGVVIISGTNGKTTTTKIVTELLEAEGLKVFTNKTGSNFVRGIIAAVIKAIDPKTKKLNADIAVLELDEAHALKFIEHIQPTYSLLLNVMRDQLDRFAEIDHIAKLLDKIAKSTTKTVVINREDSRLRSIKPTAKAQYFGLSSSLRADFPEDDALIGGNRTKTELPAAEVVLDKLKDNAATYRIGKTQYETTLALPGVYNAFNAAGALALALAILPKSEPKTLIENLGKIEPAFGRGEVFEVKGQPLELILVKNPSAFQLALKSFRTSDHATMIAINDAPADGRDISWLWNVDFTGLDFVDVVSGTRADGMALRLHYDEVGFGEVIPNLKDAITAFSNIDRPRRIFATYTAMLEIRKILSGKKLL